MSYEEIITAITDYTKKQFEQNNNQSNYQINTQSLMRYFKTKYPSFDERALNEVIEEIYARGWLLKRG